MNEGLVVNVDLILEHNTLLSNAILAFYICISVLVLFLYYRTGIKKARQEYTEKETEIERLLEFEKNHTSKLKDLIKVKQKLIAEIIKIKRKLVHERIRASKNEDDLIKEIVDLEENINENIALQNEKQEEINALKRTSKKQIVLIGSENDLKRFIKIYLSTKEPWTVFLTLRMT